MFVINSDHDGAQYAVVSLSGFAGARLCVTPPELLNILKFKISGGVNPLCQKDFRAKGLHGRDTGCVNATAFSFTTKQQYKFIV